MKKQDKPNDPESVELTEEQKIDAIADRKKAEAQYDHNCVALSDIDAGCVPIVLGEKMEVYVVVKPDGTYNFYLTYRDVPVECPAMTLALLDIDLDEPNTLN